MSAVIEALNDFDALMAEVSNLAGPDLGAPQWPTVVLAMVIRVDEAFQRTQAVVRQQGATP